MKQLILKSKQWILSVVCVAFMAIAAIFGAALLSTQTAYAAMIPVVAISVSKDDAGVINVVSTNINDTSDSSTYAEYNEETKTLTLTYGATPYLFSGTCDTEVLSKITVVNYGLIMDREEAKEMNFIDDEFSMPDTLPCAIVNDIGAIISGGTFTSTVTNNGAIYGGTFSSTITNIGTIYGGTFSDSVENSGTITEDTKLEYMPTFTSTVTNTGTISGGTFSATVTNKNGATISGGAFSAAVENNDEISDGSFSGSVENDGTISGGTFYGTVTNDKAITGGKFSYNVTNAGTITGGTFESTSTVTNESGTIISGGIFTGAVTNSGEISLGTFYGTVTNNGEISLGTFYGDVTNNAEGTISGGTFECRIDNYGRITSGNFASPVYNYNTVSGGTFATYVYNGSDTVTTAVITDGTFVGEVTNYATISGGTYASEVNNGPETISTAVINGGEFNGGAYNYGTITETTDDDGNAVAPTFSVTVINYNAISGGTFTSTVRNDGSKAAATISGGTFDGTVENYAAISGGTFNGTVGNSELTATIEGGTFKSIVGNIGVIKGGTFTAASNVMNINKITGGTFEGVMINGSSTVNSVTYYGAIYGGTFTDSVTNESGCCIYGGEFSADVSNLGTITTYTEGETTTAPAFTAGCTVTNNDTISGGTFGGTVTNNKTISGGTFNGTVTNNKTISGGTFEGKVDNNSGAKISDGTFTSTSTVSNNDVIAGGTFEGTVENYGTICGGTFASAVDNYNEIAEGNFSGKVTNDAGAIEDGTFTGEITNKDGGTISGGTFDCKVTNESGGTIEDGDFSGEVYNYGKITEGGEGSPKFTATSDMKNYGTIMSGGFYGKVNNIKNDDGTAEISWGEFFGEVTNSGTISDGAFKSDDGYNCTVKNNGAISGGTFRGAAITNSAKGSITGGTFTVKTGSTDTIDLINEGTIGGGTFEARVVVKNTGTITGDKTTNPTFKGGVYSCGTISGGTFNSQTKNFYNEVGGTISGGAFNDVVTNNCGGTISAGTFNKRVVNNAGCTISGGEFGDGIDNKAGAEIKGGTLYGGVWNYGTISGGNFYDRAYNYAGGVISGGMFDNKEIYNYGTMQQSEGSELVVGDNSSTEVYNYGTIAGGTYNDTIYNYRTDENTGNITGGTFGGEVYNGYAEAYYTEKAKTWTVAEGGEISGGEFGSDVYNYKSGVIKGNAVFNGWVFNCDGGKIEGGTFNEVVENSTAYENTYAENIKTDKSAEISGGVFKEYVYNWGGGVISGGAFGRDLDSQRDGTTVKNATISGDLYVTCKTVRENLTVEGKEDVWHSYNYCADEGGKTHSYRCEWCGAQNKDGYTGTYSPLSHYMVYDTDYTVNYTEISSDGSSCLSYDITTGTHSYRCTECGYTITEDCTYEKVPAVEPTCTSKAEYEYVCTVCGGYKKEFNKTYQAAINVTEEGEYGDHEWYESKTDGDGNSTFKELTSDGRSVYYKVCKYCGKVSDSETFTVCAASGTTGACEYENGFCKYCDGYEAATDSDGDGVYEIDNAGKLYWFAEYVNDGYTKESAILTADITVNSGVLDENGNLNSGTFREWTPIGNDVCAYWGIFDGNGKTISGLYFTGGWRYTGLFGNTSYAEIKNLTVQDSYFYGSNDVGGIVGHAADTTIAGCTFKGVIVADNGYVGGVVGVLYGGSIENCINYGNITSGDNVGGIAGYVAYTVAIKGCGNAGAISGGNNVGGIAGYGNDFDEYVFSAENCYNTGKVSGTSCVGGIAGYALTGYIKGCYNTGDVTSDYYDAGGIAGKAVGIDISSCYNTAGVTAYMYAGGIAGYTESAIQICYNTGAITAEMTAGGIAGESYCADIYLCYNTGKIKDADKEGYALTGYNRGTVLHSYFLYDSNKTAEENAAVAETYGGTAEYYNSFTDGKVAWFLNYAAPSTGTGTEIYYYQTCGTGTPCFDSAKGVVYRGYNNTCYYVYSNTDITANTANAHEYSAATCTTPATCEHCGATTGTVDENNHGWGDYVSNGDGTHTRTCAYDNTHTETTKCSGGTARCDEKAKCAYCKETYGDYDADNHSGLKLWSETAYKHTQSWDCCGAITVAEADHTFTNGVCAVCGYECQHTTYEDATCTKAKHCLICGEYFGEVDSANHTGTTKFEQTATTHKQYYTCCNAVVIDTATHTWEKGVCTVCEYECVHAVGESGKAATCTTLAVCGTCKAEFGEVDSTNHSQETTWKKTAEKHEEVYTCCGTVKTALAAHTFKDGVCTVCGYECVHEGGTATCTAKAICTYCGESYGEMAEHDYSVLTYDDDNHWYKCKACAATSAKAEHSYENSVCTVCGKGCTHTGGTATCTAQAVCTECGAKYGELSTTHHSGTEKWVTTAYKHEKVYGCCGVVTVAEADHTFTNGVCAVCGYECQHTTYEDATCTKAKHCLICGEYFGDKDSANHTGVEKWTTTSTTHEKAWTCCNAVTVENAAHPWKEGTNICSVCGYGCLHSVGENGTKATCTTLAVCGTCGLSFGDPAKDNHTGTTKWIQTAEKHEEVYTCCGAVKTELTAHTFEDSVCMVCGYECEQHAGGVATCTALAVCAYCGEEYGEKAAHSYELECDSEYHWYECTACGALKEAKAAHSGGTATCSHLAQCSVCNNHYGTYNSAVHTDANGTAYATELRLNVAATCTSRGYSGDTYCTSCGAIISKGEILAPTGHSYVEHKAIAATCTAVGCEAYKTCSLCDYTTYVEIEALGHDYTVLEKDSAGHWYKCSRCESKQAELVHTSDSDTDTTCNVCGWVIRYTVTIDGGSVNGEETTTAHVNANGTVTIKAIVPEGKKFVGWYSGETLISTNEEYTFAASENVTYTAKFEDENTGLSGGAIAGIVVGSVAAVGLGGFAVYWFVFRKRKPV